MTGGKHITLAIVMLLLAGCTDFFAKVEPHNDWVVSEEGRIILHTRPEGFSTTASPDPGDINMLLDNQNFYLQMITDTLGLQYNGKVLIYLFNTDEALDAIGTQNGGHSMPDRSAIFYAFRRPAWFDVNGRLTFMGAHEMVHVVTHREFGKPFTKMMSEGYATAIDGAYGRRSTSSGTIVAKTVKQWMIEHYEAGQVLDPMEMLHEGDFPENIYYPNAAFFIEYLWNRFGIETINKLFTIPASTFENRFRFLTGITFQQAAADYLLYCQQVLN